MRRQRSSWARIKLSFKILFSHNFRYANLLCLYWQLHSSYNHFWFVYVLFIFQCACHIFATVFSLTSFIKLVNSFFWLLFLHKFVTIFLCFVCDLISLPFLYHFVNTFFDIFTKKFTKKLSWLYNTQPTL